jgi:hypothetical protein
VCACIQAAPPKHNDEGSASSTVAEDCAAHRVAPPTLAVVWLDSAADMAVRLCAGIQAAPPPLKHEDSAASTVRMVCAAHRIAPPTLDLVRLDSASSMVAGLCAVIQAAPPPPKHGVSVASTVGVPRQCASFQEAAPPSPSSQTYASSTVRLGSAQYQTARATLPTRLDSATSTVRLGFALLQVAPPLPNQAAKGVAPSTASSNASVASTPCGKRCLTVGVMLDRQAACLATLTFNRWNRGTYFVEGWGTCAWR